jgi:hypothetical protein
MRTGELRGQLLRNSAARDLFPHVALRNCCQRNISSVSAHRPEALSHWKGLSKTSMIRSRRRTCGSRLRTVSLRTLGRLVELITTEDSGVSFIFAGFGKSRVASVPTILDYKHPADAEYQKSVRSMSRLSGCHRSLMGR